MRSFAPDQAAGLEAVDAAFPCGQRCGRSEHDGRIVDHLRAPRSRIELARRGPAVCSSPSRANVSNAGSGSVPGADAARRRLGEGRAEGSWGTPLLSREHDEIGRRVRRRLPCPLKLLSLFSGAGGLDRGLEAAGFEIAGCVERDRDCLETLSLRPHWPIAPEGDVEKVEPSSILKSLGLKAGDVTLLAGGPPCQPFSKSGQWVTGTTQRMSDPRAVTLVAFLGMLGQALPDVMLLENVKGLVAHPRPGSAEDQALEVLRAALGVVNDRHGTRYDPQVLHLDAADFGVPQHRERVFVIAHREGKTLGPIVPRYGPAAHDTNGNPAAMRFATAWDVLGEFDSDVISPELALSGKWAALLPTIPEGNNYLFHTSRGGGHPLFGWRTRYWSFLLKLAKARPSWTIQAQPGPATGPFHWRNRRLSVREMARLQSFPDDHDFAGSYLSVRRQIGNAVPVALAERIGLAIRQDLLDQNVSESLTTLLPLRDDCPPPESVPKTLPRRYRARIGQHAEHPGAGLGPSAIARTSGSA
jgi:DNA (cytosine-5)-methyltransferase 1